MESELKREKEKYHYLKGEKDDLELSKSNNELKVRLLVTATYSE